MKYSHAANAFAAIAAALAVLAGAAQTTTIPIPATPQEKPPVHKGQVILSRSTDESGQTTTTVAQPVQPPAVKAIAAPAAADAERQAVTFTDFDMDVRLRSAEQHIAVRALVTVRNDGKAPLAHIPLQISSSLAWERIRVAAKDTAFTVATLNSDADHTGQLHEAAIPLAQPLAPGASLQLDVAYCGAIAPSAQRLLAIGTPQDVALHSDWDQIGVAFTGLRGFGNVVWYPVSSVPVILGDGAHLFDEIGEHKLRLAGARFRLRLTVEYPPAQPPTIALVNGHPVPLALTNATGNAEVAGVALASAETSTLGFEAPSLFLAIQTAYPGANLTLWTSPQNQPVVKAWTVAAAEVTPFLQGWLGKSPRAQLTILDPPDPEDSAFETGALLVTPVRDASPDQLDGILAHALSHAWMQSPRAWLSEGVAHFMGTLWVEKQRGRDQALGALESARTSLALIEPESPGTSAGQPLAAATSPAYFRAKATYVLWMLRDLAGDPTLSAALRAYDPALDSDRKTGRSYFETLIEQAGARADLSWFFADWVDADKGLPEVSILGVFPNPAATGSWLVAVNLANSGYAATEVPVTVRSDSNSVTQRVLIPARGKAVQRILIQGKPNEVQVNDGTIPESQASVHVRKLDQTDPTPGSSSQSAPPQP